MASFFLAPDPIQSTFFIPGGAVPGNGVQLFTYVAGSVSTKVTVYKDNLGNAAWTNPIVLDSGGNLPNGGSVWIPAGVTIKAVWAPSNDTDPPGSPYRTMDNLPGVNDTTSSPSEWQVGPAPTFVSGTQFTLVGDQTLIFTKARRLKFTVTAGTVYGAISSVTFGALTTVNVAFATGALDAGLSAVSYSLLAVDNPSINADYVFKQASSVASAGNGTTNIWGSAGNSVHITGTNTIFNFSTAPYVGAERMVIWDAALSVNSSATITMAGNANVTTAVNDRAWVYADSLTTAIVSFYKQSGLPTVLQTAPTVSTFTATGVYNKPANLRAALVMIKAGGASGGTNNAVNQIRGGGGGEGETGWGLFQAASINASTAVTIGPGGGAITAGTGLVGSTGSTTSFGALMTALGGTGGGSGQTGGTGGQGGTGGTGGNWYEPGIPGQCGADATGNTIGINATGGGRGGGPAGSTGVANSGGGGGSGSNSQASGPGAGGRCVVIEFY